jgi:predicted alpha/beta-hydrolase family hydrolase
VDERAFRLATSHGPVSAALTGDGGGPVLGLAHGAGNGMDAPLLVGLAGGLAAAGVSCLRFNFPYKEKGRKAPDREPVLRDAWSAAFEEAGRHGDPVWAGGKSMGGRIASMMAADGSLAVAGLVFVGYPLHAPGRTDRIRDAHLAEVGVPMLFLQGTADRLARWDLLEGAVRRLGNRAVLHPVEGGDHSFRVRGTPRDDEGTGTALGEVAARFILEHS